MLFAHKESAPHQNGASISLKEPNHKNIQYLKTAQHFPTPTTAEELGCCDSRTVHQITPVSELSVEEQAQGELLDILNTQSPLPDTQGSYYLIWSKADRDGRKHWDGQSYNNDPEINYFNYGQLNHLIAEQRTGQIGDLKLVFRPKTSH
jgi:hypothetical protein